MKRFDVQWTDEALEHLTDAWLHSANPSNVADAESRISGMLQFDPSKHGELLSEDLWILRIHPLKVYFEIWESERIVQVTDALLFPD